MLVRSTLSNEEIMESLRSGDGEGFSIIFKEWYRPVYHYAFSILENTQEAEDVTDECFIKLWEKHSKFSSLPHCKSYLFKCVRNASIDKLTERKRMGLAKKELLYLISSN